MSGDGISLSRRGALGKLRECRADLAAHAENDDVAVDLRQLGDKFRRRCGHHVFEVFGVAKTIGKVGHSIVRELATPARRLYNGDRY